MVLNFIIGDQSFKMRGFFLIAVFEKSPDNVFGWGEPLQHDRCTNKDMNYSTFS